MPKSCYMDVVSGRLEPGNNSRIPCLPLLYRKLPHSSGLLPSHLEDTFLLTWDDRLTIQDPEALLSPQEYRQPIELLILSAWQTARVMIRPFWV
ncbi:MAG: hypothetical protein AAGC93_14005 [Cyanobacteria bacterium P01_F01_bin.53]